MDTRDSLDQRSVSGRYYLDRVMLDSGRKEIWVEGPKNLRRILDILAEGIKIVDITSEDGPATDVGKTFSGEVRAVSYKNPDLPEQEGDIYLREHDTELFLHLEEFQRRGSPEVIRRNIQFIQTDEKSRYVT